LENWHFLNWLMNWKSLYFWLNYFKNG